MVSPGKERVNIVLQPVEGKALPVYTGEVLRITQVGNGQCVDFNCFNLQDYKERMCVGFTRKTHTLRPGKGDYLWSNPPRYRPMMRIQAIPPTCVTDTLHGRCNALIFENYYGFDRHTNCQDTLAEAIGEYGLTPDDVHDCFNFWMDTGWDDEGETYIRRNSGRKGDYVDLLALMNVLVVPIVCGAGDVHRSGNFFPKPIRVQVFEPSEGTNLLAKRCTDHMRFKSQRTRADFRVRKIHADPGLKPVPGYKPEFVNYPLASTEIKVRLTDREYDQLQRLRFAGYQDDDEILREAVMGWYVNNRLRRGRLKEPARATSTGDLR